MKADWSRPDGTQPEILVYLEHRATKYAITSSIRSNTAVRRALWDEECLVWRLITDQGDEVVADVVVSAIDMFNELEVAYIMAKLRQMDDAGLASLEVLPEAMHR